MSMITCAFGMLLRKTQDLISRFYKNTSQKMDFPVDLVTFAEEILNGKPHFFVQ